MAASQNPVYLWKPNLVGYARVFFMVCAFYVCFTRPSLAACFYVISQGLDAVDGQVARAYQQCSKFGAVLDMLTDRMSTAVLLIVLALQYQSYWGFFAFLVVLDVVSHWFQMYSKLSQKISTHKGSKNPILNFYYCDVLTFWPRLPWLLVFCVGNEMFLVAMYLLSFTDGGSKEAAGGFLWHATLLAAAVVSFPIFFCKQFFNVIQLTDAAGEVADQDWADHQKAKAQQ